METSNILTDPLPWFVTIHGQKYPIRADFRTGLQVNVLMRKNLPDEDKIERMLEFYYPEEMPDDLNSAISAVISFLAGGEKIKSIDGKRKPDRREKEIFSFSQDAVYIYAAFFQQYGLNLQRIKSDELHWWEFLALFEALDDNTLIKRIMYYRSVKLGDFPKKERQRLLRLKQLYRLEDDIPADARAALAKRNADMKAYVRRRVQEAVTRR